MPIARRPKYSGIVVKKYIHVAYDEHHNSAWKVAYADFVTAMMAFFLLLWLYSTTTPTQKAQIAEYFTPSMGLKDSMGVGFMGGKHSLGQEGKLQTNKNAPGLLAGQTRQGPERADPDRSNPANAHEDADATGDGVSGNGEDDADRDIFKSIGEEIKQALEDNPELRQFKNNISAEETPEGLSIEVIDSPNNPLFSSQSALLTRTGKAIFSSMAKIISSSSNQIQLTGHTAAQKANATDIPTNPDYTNWELSTDRANAVRRTLMDSNVEPRRIINVIGLADRELLIPKDPQSQRNERITITLMKRSYFNQLVKY